MGWPLRDSHPARRGPGLKFKSIPLQGACIVEYEPVADERGFFARSWCREEFAREGLNSQLAQCNISFNKLKGTLRGLHYQEKPHEESKLIRCSAGAIFDVILDLRASSPTYGQFFSVKLAAVGCQMLYVPEGMAHGFQTLEDSTEVLYQMSETYRAECARGIRWNDPAFRISWPLPHPILSERDRNYPDFRR